MVIKMCGSWNEINEFEIRIIIETINKINSTSLVSRFTGGEHIPVYKPVASVNNF
jgi:hypothetical protein